MHVQIEEVSPVEKKLIVEVPWSSVSGKLGVSYRQLAKNVNLKGFRKGKVPRSVLERMFGDKVRAEVAGEFVRESFITAIQEHKLQAVAEPRVESPLAITNGEALSFEAIVEVKGDVKVADYKGLTLTKRPVDIPEDSVEEAVQRLRKMHVELHPIEGRDTLTAEDAVVVSVTGTIGEDPVEEPEVRVDLSNTENDPLPGFIAALIGLPVNATDHDVVLEIPEDFPQPALSGKTATLKVTVTEANLQVLPELDDDFAKDTGYGDTVEEVREHIRKTARERQEEEIRVELNHAAVEELVKRNQIPVASSLTERVIQNRRERLQRMMTNAGATGAIEPSMISQLADGAEDEVRGQLLLEQLAEEEGLTVSDEEIDARLAEMAARSKKTAGRLKSELIRNNRLDDIVYQLRQDKAVNFLLEHATVEEKAPEPAAQEGEEPAEGGEPPDAEDK